MLGSSNGIKLDDYKEYPPATKYITSKTEVCAASSKFHNGKQSGNSNQHLLFSNSQ